MVNIFGCDDCGRLIAGADRVEVLRAVRDHETGADHEMNEMEVENCDHP